MVYPEPFVVNGIGEIVFPGKAEGDASSQMWIGRCPILKYAAPLGNVINWSQAPLTDKS